MTPNEFRSELKKLSLGYLFYGEEGYLKRHYLDSVRKATVEEGDAFNHILINSENYSPSRLFASIEALPMMAEKKLIEVSSIMFSDMNESELDEFCSVIERLPDYEYNALVVYTEPDELDVGTKKQPTASFSRLCQSLKPVAFERETPARLSSWIAKHFASELIIAPPDEVKLLLDRCGCDMFALSGEIDKLACYIKSQGRERLTREDVLYVGTERKEIAAFDFVNAISDAKTDRAYYILGDMIKQKEKPEIILASISRTIGDMSIIKALSNSGMTIPDIAKKLKFNEYRATLYAKSASRISSERLKDLTRRCYEADIQIKSTPVNSYTVLERLVAETSRR